MEQPTDIQIQNSGQLSAVLDSTDKTRSSMDMNFQDQKLGSTSRLY